MVKISKQGFKKIMLITMIVCVCVFSILIDLISANFSFAIFKDMFYWMRTLSINAAVLCLIFSVRSITRDKELSTNEEVLVKQGAIDTAYATLNNLNLNTQFDEHICVENDKRKKVAYINGLKRKMIKKTNPAKHKLLTAKLATAETDYKAVNIKYNKVRFSTIFGKTDAQSDDDDLSEHVGREYLNIVVNKMLWVIAFTFLLYSFVLEGWTGGAAIWYYTAIKLAQLALGAYMGATLGTDYIRGEYSNKLTLRLNFVQQFIESGAKQITSQPTTQLPQQEIKQPIPPEPQQNN